MPNSCKEQYEKQMKVMCGNVDGKESLLVGCSVYPCGPATQLVGNFFAKGDWGDAFKMYLMMWMLCFLFSAGYFWNIMFWCAVKNGGK